MSLFSMIAIAIYFIAMIGIGLYAYRVADNNVSGFLLGGRQMGPAVTALSAGASDMSGWMVMGLPGALYLSGLSAAWIAVSLVVGAALNYRYIAARLRTYTELAGDALTLPAFFENRCGATSHWLRLLASMVIILFFTLYTSAGLVSGGKFFESILQLDYLWGVYATATVVVVYTLFGGFLAVSLTDFVQGCIMLIALVLVPIVAIQQLGGVDATTAQIKLIDPALLSLWPETSALGTLSLLAWGLGYFGQPHIIVRFMAIRSIDDVPTATAIGMGWMVMALIGAMATGLVGVAYIAVKGIDLGDPETIFIILSQLLFHPLITGFLLAAILAAIMSTVSSQLLVASSSLTEDLYKLVTKGQLSPGQQVYLTRLWILLVAFMAIALAQQADSSILDLVANAWAGFGAAFGPLIIFSLYWPRINHQGAMAGIVTGAVTVMLWVYLPVKIAGQAPSDWLYEMVPGFVLSAVAIVIVSLLTPPPSRTAQSQYDAMLSQITQPKTKLKHSLDPVR